VSSVPATSVEQATRLADAEFLELFPTPLLRCQWPESEQLNRELREVILDKFELEQGRSRVQRSNIGGWQSLKDLHTWPQPCVARLNERIDAFVREMVRRVVPDPLPGHLEGWQFQAWANVSRRGAKNRSHVHLHEKSTVWSGIYYVDAGEDLLGGAASGLTKLEDRSGVPMEIMRSRDPFEREISICPRPGLMVLFSSKLWHRVETFQGEGSRITIAFNLSHPGFVIPAYPESKPPEATGAKAWLWRNFRGIMHPASMVKARIHKPFG
jgi:uncharacterized protein (TIGR02466 family)